MKDYDFITDDGREIPISKMSNEDLVGCLEHGIVTYGGEVVENVTERLRIELLIRRLNLPR